MRLFGERMIETRQDAAKPDAARTGLAPVIWVPGLLLAVAILLYFVS